MIRMVTGLMGGGKTYFMVRKQVEEWIYTERFVPTNCRELNLPRLNEYLQEIMKADIDAGRREPVDLNSRMVLIPREGVFEFYRYRSGGLVLPKPPSRETIKPWSRKSFDFAMNNFYRDRDTWEIAGPNDPPSGIGYFEKVADPRHPEWSTPCTYFLTEFHDFFNAQDWQDVGPAAQYYISKHRHLHDELVFETQMPEQVDAACRRLVEQTYVVENHYQRSFGPFKNRGCFKAKVYFKTQTKLPYDSLEFYLDPKGIGSCYNTTGALGLMDRGSETKSKGFGIAKFKLPWWALWVGGALAAALLMFVLAQVPGLLGRLLGGALVSTSNSMKEQLDIPTSGSSTVVREGTPSSDVVRTTAAPRMAEGVTVTGFMGSRVRGRLVVYLSDGRVYDERSGVKIQMDRLGAVIDGVRYFHAKPKPSAPPVYSAVWSPSSVSQPVPAPLPAPVVDPVSELPPPPAGEMPAWQLHSDGVQRLVNPSSIGGR